MMMINMTENDEWTMFHLEKVLSSLKKKKSKDPYGLVNELFRPEVIGADLKLALLKMFTQTAIKI